MQLFVSDSTILEEDIQIVSAFKNVQNDTSPFEEKLAAWEASLPKLNNRIIVDREISVNLIPAKRGSIFRLRLQNLVFKKKFALHVNDENLISFLISNCIFEDGIILYHYPSAILTLKDNQINGFTRMGIHDGIIEFRNNKFLLDATGGKVRNPFHGSLFGKANMFYEKSVLDTLKIHSNKTYPLVSSGLQFSNLARLEFHQNTIRSGGPFFITINDIGPTFPPNFTRNEFFCDLELEGSGSTDLIFKRNQFDRSVTLEKLSYPLSSDIDWSYILDNLSVKRDTILKIDDVPVKYGLGKNSDSFSIELPATFLFNGGGDTGLLDTKAYKSLIYSYKKLFDDFKEKGDLENANRCFVLVKDIEGRRLSAIYDKDGGFRNLFRYMLNRLMKFYTNHATDPALALVISFYIILFFGIFYCFFPSEWDVQSKSRIVANFKDFVKKNEKGYFKPFLSMSYGILISLANAFALSLNSFVTLGFGNIPTKGIARYVCILQGFLGWFLLSIFTVALFNQVLF